MPIRNTETLNGPGRIPTPLNIMGIPVTPFDSYNNAADCIAGRIAGRKKTFCIAISPEKIYRSQCDKDLAQIISNADIHICDGIGTALSARVLTGRKIRRITGVQLFLDLVARSEKEGLRIFMLGASPESNNGACEKLLMKHPDLKIVGCQDGYFSDDEAVVRMINDSGADMLFVAMGSPKQEKWISKFRDEINAPYCMGVGGAFDVVSGRVKWAPKFFRKTGTEFLYRLVKEPKRWRRYLTLPKIVMMVLKRKLYNT